jgi:hypothetical protein
MADDAGIIQIRSQPGIKRDGTKLEGDAYVDGRWARFQRGLPRKIGGYRAVNKYFEDVVRALNGSTQNSLTYIHAGSANALNRLYLDSSGNTSVIADRTPTSGFTPDDRNLWTLAVDSKLVAGVPVNLILAQVAPTLDDISCTEDGALFYGELTDTAALTTIALPTGGSVTGGIVALHPYTFYFGNDGQIGWSIAGDPTDLTGAGSGFVNATSQKVVAGLPLRGGPGNSPSGLFWSLDALVRASFVGGAPVFQFDTISAETSILSSRCVIEYDGVFYWIGVDRFLMYNGVVREVPNDMNLNFFFDNLDPTYRQKVFATKVPRFGEIWWCFPTKGFTEPNWAIIYNVRENLWYDTPLPTTGRAAGIWPSVFPKPIMTAAQGNTAPIDYRVTEDSSPRVTEDGANRVTEDSEAVTYKMWIHEDGVDEIDGQSLQPILSFFETADISLPIQNGQDKALQVLVLEPDFVQAGDMSVQVRGRRNARAPEVNGDPMTFPAEATSVEQEIVYLKDQRRELRFYFESNAVGGDYQMGTILAHIRPGDGTTL